MIASLTVSSALRTLAIVSLAAVCAGSTAYAGYKGVKRFQNRLRPPPVTATGDPSVVAVGPSPSMPADLVRHDVSDVRVTEVARGLQIVWALRVASDGRLFITERRGRVLVLNPGAPEATPYTILPTALGGESGLMGMALHPRFPSQPYIYVMYTARTLTGGVNRVSRLVAGRDGAGDELVLVDDIPASRNHDGGALEFGPDGMLYVGTGDASIPAFAQDLSRLNGKILRIAPDGAVPADNPFPGSPVWAYGFRNVSGLAFHPDTGALWAATHGPSSVAPGEPKHMDSVYVVRRGANHGWPLHLGGAATEEIVSPAIFYPHRAVPPGGLTFVSAAGPWRANLFMSGLRSQEMVRHVIEGVSRVAAVERWWPDRYGRIRAVTAAPDGSLYFGTSNRDGRAHGSYPSFDSVYRVRRVR